MDTCFENETKAWLERHIDDIFQRTIMADIIENFENIHKTLHFIKENQRGFKTPFGVDNKIGKALASSVIPSGAGVVLSFVIHRIITTPSVLSVIAATGTLAGLVMIGLNAYTYEITADFTTVCIKAFEARLNVCTLEKIMCHLRKEYYDRMKQIIREYLEGDLKEAIERIHDNLLEMRNEQNLSKAVEKPLYTLQWIVKRKIERLQQIERIDITTK